MTAAISAFESALRFRVVVRVMVPTAPSWSLSMRDISDLPILVRGCHSSKETEKVRRRMVVNRSPRMPDRASMRESRKIWSSAGRGSDARQR